MEGETWWVRVREEMWGRREGPAEAPLAKGQARRVAPRYTVKKHAKETSVEIGRERRERRKAQKVTAA